MMLQTNGKLKNSTIFTYAFNLPAVKTCPGAGICAGKDGYCFAFSEERCYPSARAFRALNFAASKQAGFIENINTELAKLRLMHKKAGTVFAIRIHASGDFYSVAYIQKWFSIIELNPDLVFYAYTKSVHLFSRLAGTPVNLTLVYSLGGRYDHLIDVETDRHARIFASEQDVLDAGYVLASEDDTAAWLSLSGKIGLVAFGATKKWAQAEHGRIQKDTGERVTEDTGTDSAA